MDFGEKWFLCGFAQVQQETTCTKRSSSGNPLDSQSSFQDWGWHRPFQVCALHRQTLNFFHPHPCFSIVMAQASVLWMFGMLCWWKQHGFFYFQSHNLCLEFGCDQVCKGALSRWWKHVYVYSSFQWLYSSSIDWFGKTNFFNNLSCFSVVFKRSTV